MQHFESSPVTGAAFGRCRRPSSGFLYVAVLFTTLIVMAAVTAALSISTSNLRGETDRSSRGRALRFAESEVHRLAASMRAGWQWRSSSTNDALSAWYPITVNGVDATGTSQVRHRFFDADGDLADDPWDSVELTVHARVDRCESAISVRLESDPTAVDVLSYAVTASDDIQFESGGTLTCERPVQVVDDCKTTSWGVLTTPRLECSNNVQMTLRGDRADSSVTMPSYDVVAKYISQGTEIPLTAVPLVGSERIIEDRLLSPTVNPLGAVDPAGIYWLDAAGGKVVISHCRLDATLAIRNASEIEITGGIVWNNPTGPDAILVSDSPLRFQNVEATLSETARNVNFNPTSSPYRQTLSNDTATDHYPTQLRGVIYTSDDLRVDPLVADAMLHVNGVIVGRDIRIDGHVVVTHLDELQSSPPPGLSNPTLMRLVRGSMRRIPSP